MPTPHIEIALPAIASHRLLLVPGGEFLMGSADGDKDAYDSEKPAHRVRLDDFYIGEFQVSQELWQAVIGTNPSRFKSDRRPVENVSWFDAAVFCNALSEMTKKEPCYFSDAAFKKPYGKTADGWESPNEGGVFINYNADGYRLPTEAEWEYAARGGPWWESEGYRYAGSDLLEQVGWYKKNSGNETRDVGLLLPNALGLCDMSGNVWEWCNDWYGTDYYAKCKAEGLMENPRGPEKGESAVLRGGAWVSNDDDCRVAVLSRNDRNLRYIVVGLRLARAASEGGM